MKKISKIIPNRADKLLERIRMLLAAESKHVEIDVLMRTMHMTAAYIIASMVHILNAETTGGPSEDEMIERLINDAKLFSKGMGIMK